MILILQTKRMLIIMMNLFTANESGTVTNSKSLRGSDQLVASSDAATNRYLAFVNEPAFQADEANVASLKLTFTDNSMLDTMIFKTACVDQIDVDNFKALELTDTELEKILKSQQSKRSRARSKQMTLENYKSLVSAACAEHILRTAYNKAKSAGGKIPQAIDLTEEAIAAYAADPDSLSKAIRNIQSQKSIAKAKADFDENSERYQALLAKEASLKALRTGTTTTVVIPEEVQQAQEILAEANVDQMSAKDAKAMLHQLQEKLAALGAKEEAVNE